MCLKFMPSMPATRVGTAMSAAYEASFFVTSFSASVQGDPHIQGDPRNVLGATASLLLLASNPHGSEHLRDLLVGQILWADPSHLGWTALVYAAVLAAWFGLRERIGRIGFYVLFALTVTASVQLVGLYLVFASLIVPPLATRRMARRRLPAAWVLGVVGYAAGLVLSTAFDLPSGAVIVWALAVCALAWYPVTKGGPTPRTRH